MWLNLKSLYFFSQAVDYVSQDGPYTDDDEKIVKSLRLSCWLNWAACCLNLNNFREVIDLCSKVIILRMHLTQINY